MAEAITVSAPISGTDRTLEFSTGVLAPQSQGAVVARVGNTQALVTTNGATFTRDGIDFFPLTVDVEEKMYTVGKIPGSFFRREGRPPDQAVLTCRLIDRPLRPSFADGYRNETQVVSTIIGADQVNPHDVISINGASAALLLSGLPFDGPIGAVRLAYSTDGEWIPHPTYEEIDQSTFQLVVAGRPVGDDDVAIMMVEGNGTEKAWSYYEAGAPKVTEAVIAEDLEACKTWIGESIALQRELVAKAGVRPPLAWESQLDYDDEVLAAVEGYRTEIAAANTGDDKTERNAATTALRDRILEELTADDKPLAGRSKEVLNAVRAVTKKAIRKRLIDDGVRIDGRGPRDLRSVTAEVGVVPTAHGTGLFQRGETQVLNVLTLGMPRMDQLLDTLGIETKKRYMHHYNMPPYSNGETGRIGGTKRREVGHGMLAERALLPVVPSLEEWPYALRLVSEVLSSNGSTSMGSVCTSSLSLMDGGVPIKAPVSGIAMGLVKEGDTYVTLTDILGAEDTFGDMDFKIAGTEDFITALQLDTKIDGLPADVLSDALQQAREARLQILEVMNATIPAPRDDVGETAPKMISFEIPIDKIGEVIGPKGKVINAIQAETGADISVDDDGTVGTVSIGSPDRGAVQEAERQIKLILDPPTAELGAVYKGRVVNVTKFGAFVNILPGRDGLVHISKLGGGKRIDRVEDVLNLGDEIEVRVDDVDPNGKVSLTPADQPVEESRSRGGSRDRDRGGRDGGSRDGGGRDGGGRDHAPRSESVDLTEAPGSTATEAEEVSFEEAFDAEARAEFGDLGPASGGRPPERDGGQGGPPPATPLRIRPVKPAVGDGPIPDGHTPHLPVGDIRVTRLPSGRRVVTDRMIGAASVAALALVEVGGRDEPPAMAGASHFLEHLLCKGSAERSAAEVAEDIDRRGGELDAVTDRERTAVQVRVPAGEGDFALGLLGDLVLRPAMRVGEIEIERRVILEELAQAQEDPEDRAHTLAAAALYPEHALGREVIGDPSTLAAMARAEIATFHREHYVPGEMVIAAAGAVDHDRVVETVASWDAAADGALLSEDDGNRLPRRVAPGPATPTTSVLRRHGEQVHLVMGWRLGSVADDDRPALAVGTHILGGGPASRLYRSVRDERGLSYAVDASAALHCDAGTVTTYAGCSPGAVAEVRSLIAEEAGRLATDGPSEREVEVAVGYLVGSSTLALEDSGTRAWRAAIEELERGGVKPASQRIDAFRRVTAADVARVIRDLAGTPTVVAVGPVPRRVKKL